MVPDPHFLLRFSPYPHSVLNTLGMLSIIEAVTRYKYTCLELVLPLLLYLVIMHSLNPFNHPTA